MGLNVDQARGKCQLVVFCEGGRAYMPILPLVEDREGEKLNMLFKRPLLVYILFIYLYTIFKA